MAKEFSVSQTALSSTSSLSLVSTHEDHDSRHLFRGIVADLNFRSSSNRKPIIIKDRLTLHDILVNGPAAFMEIEKPDLRWIHLPANNMAWVEEIMSKLSIQLRPGSDTPSTEQQDQDRYRRILKDRSWRNAFHGRSSEAIHARFMTPLAARYSSKDNTDSESDSSEITKWSSANVTALFMPYLHWEDYNSWKSRQQHIAYMKQRHLNGQPCDCIVGPNDEFDSAKHREVLLLHQYLYHDHPLHDRRSLEQSYYFNLRNVALRDEDQIIGQHTWKDRASNWDPGRKMMITDQLWMWIVDNRIIVTAFPETGTSNASTTGANVASLICERLREAVLSGSVRSTNKFVALVVSTCTGFFLRCDQEPDLTFFEFFANEIGFLKDELDKMYKRFHKTSRIIEEYYTKPGVSVELMSSQLEELFSINDEVRLMEQIEMILLDLDQIDYLYNQQEEVLQSLKKMNQADKPYESTTLADLSDDARTHREAWRGMAESARERRTSLQGLLDLKQRQANVSEARSIRYQLSVSAKQGRSIMLLTVFTVFFLPVSVMAAIFGMNATELVGKDGGKVSFGTISFIAFPITFALVVSALIFAFKNEARKTTIQFWTAVSHRCNSKDLKRSDDV